MLFAINSSVFAEYCYLDDPNSGSWLNGQKLGYYIEQSGKIIEFSVSADKNQISKYGETIELTFSGRFQHNVVLMHRNWFKYCGALGSFDITYYVNGKQVDSEVIKITPHAKNEEEINKINNVECNTFYETFSRKIKLKTSTTSTNNTIKDIYVKVRPTDSSPSQSVINGSHYEWGGYVFDQSQRSCPFTNFLKEHLSTTKTLTYKFIPKESEHIITTDNQVNPLKTLKNSTYNLIYGDENAAIKLSLPKENVSAKMNNLPAQSAMVVGVNQNPFPTSVSFCSSSVGDGCGEYNYIEYRKTSPQVLKTALNAYSALANKVRFKGLMLQTEVNDLTGKTTFKTPSIVTLGTAESANIWYSKTYKLADMQYATAKISQGTNITKGGNILKVAHKLLYLDLAQLANTHNGFLELGYASSHNEEGKTLISRIATYNDALNIPSSNTLQFYVVPKAIFSNLKEEDLATKYICIPNNNNPTSENEVIILYENKIKSEDGSIDALTYEPEYFWEFSYDKKTWNKVDANNYIDPNFDIDKGDLYVKPSILSNNRVVYFRQSAILKAFSSEIKNDLYTESLNNRYYIRINSDQYYTYKKMPIPVAEQFAFTQGDDYISIDTKECYSNIEVFNGKKIKFDLVPNANMSEEEYNALRNIASYTLTRKKIIGNNENKEIIPYNSETGYTITNYDGSKWVFDASIEFCNGMKLQKSITINAYDDITVNLNEITTETKGASIISRDNVYNVLQVMCPKDEDFKIRYFLDTENRQNLDAYEAKAQYVCPNYPDMVPYPDHVAPNFEDMSRTELVQYISDKGWSFEDDNMGQSLDEATRTQIKTYLIYKDNFVYKADSIAYVDAYKADSVAYYADCELKNEWFPFQDSLNYTATLKNITDNENEAVFYMRVRSSDGCYSDDVTFYVTYFDGITGNTIAFNDDKYKGKDIISVTAGEGNPFIKGDLVEGAYGIPKDNTDCTYTYVWQFYNTDTDAWDVLTDTNGNAFEYVEKNNSTGNRPQLSQQFISLDANTIANISAAYPGGLQIRRVVYSQKGNDANAKLPSESNVLQIYAAKPIEEDKFTYYFNGDFCPGNGYAYFEFTDVEFAENEVLETKILNKDQEDLEVLLNYDRKLGGVVNPTKDISLSLCRIDTLTKVRSNAVILDIDVPELKADFIVYVDGKEHKLTEDVINVQAGSRVVLYNESENGFDGGSIYNWTLQVQKDGYEAQSSEKEDPVCYLYNPGINTIKLEVVSSNRCRNSITANNINVILAEGRGYPIISHFEESREQLLAVAPYMNVSPTLLIDESVVTINSNIDRYDVIVTDIAGKVMLTAENLGLRSQLNLDFLPDGIYILHASGNTFKLIKK